MVYLKRESEKRVNRERGREGEREREGNHLVLLFMLCHSPPLPLQAKVNNQGQIGMAYTQSLRSGVKLNLSGLVEGRNINAGGHKLGLSLDFES